MKELFQLNGISVDNCSMNKYELDISLENQRLARGLAVSIGTTVKTNEKDQTKDEVVSSIGIYSSHSGDFHLKIQDTDDCEVARKARALATMLLLAADMLETRQR